MGALESLGPSQIERKTSEDNQILTRQEICMEMPVTILFKPKWWVAAALFAVCVAPTFISYQPWVFRWDDSDYLQRSIAVSRAFWSGNRHALVEGMAGIRPPIMTLLGLPWRRLASWDDAGKCFITLAALTSLLAATCLFLLLRIGVKPVFLIIASACLFASIGPHPGAVATQSGDPFNTHAVAVAFLADGLFAWIALAAILLIPYEARTFNRSIKDAIVRGILWGSILSLGAITKVSFFYFIVLIVPVLFVIRLHHGGLGGALAALIAAASWSAPAAIYWFRWGRSAWDNARASSFGRIASLWYTPLPEFLRNTIRESPGLVFSILLTAAAILYLIARKRAVLRGMDFLAFLIMIGFGIVVLKSINREIRYVFPAIVALPFLIGVLMSGEAHPVRGRSAALAAAIVFCGLVALSVPMRHRPDRQSLVRCDAVLAQTAKCNAKRILLATDSPTLNADLMRLAIAVSASSASVNVDTLAYKAMYGVPIEEDFRVINESDQVVFQDRDAWNPPFTNQRAPEYERYIQQGEYIPFRVGNDVTSYSARCEN
jgi:hypothetical protein